MATKRSICCVVMDTHNVMDADPNQQHSISPHELLLEEGHKNEKSIAHRAPNLSGNYSCFYFTNH